MKRRGSPCCVAAVCASLLWCGNAAGAGIAIMEQSVKQLGVAFAGGAAAADDATTIFYNPAGLTRLPGAQAVAGVNLLFPSARFRNERSLHLTGEPLRGGNGGDAGDPMVTGSVYYSHRFNSRLSGGLGVFSPFGLRTDYEPTWVGRYHAVKSEFTTFDINPALAYRITDRLSVGVGMSAQYARAELGNAIDFGTIFAASGAAGAVPQGNDGFVTFNADSWSWGYNIGALYEFTGSTRAGVAYRSRVDHTLTGDARFAGVPSPNPTGRFADTGVTADVTLPDSLSVSIRHQFSPDWAAMADVTWTHWSTIGELRIRFDNPAERDAVTTLGWKDTFRYSLGAVYAPGPWTFRAGAAYDESPVHGALLRTPRLPDDDRIWLAAGFGYRISDTVAIDAGYAHLFVKDAEIRKTATGEDLFRGALSGSYDNRVDVVSAEVTWSF